MLAVLYFLLFAIALIGVKINRDGFNDPLDRRLTTSVKGFFIGSVFIGHLAGYVGAGGYVGGGIGDYTFYVIQRIQGQLLVVMFLFYSGYGVFTAARKRGLEYVKSMPMHRIFTTLLNFDVAVAVFTIAMLISGGDFKVEKFVLSLLGWDSMGNSNWYIFAILVCYTIAWLGLRCSMLRNCNCAGVICIVATFGVVLILSRFKQEWWYNTMMAFPLGGLYAEYREFVEKLVQRNYWRCLFSVLLVFCVLMAWFQFHRASVSYNFLAMSFALFVVIVSMKIRFENGILFWMGTNLFPLYIYQRLPMKYFGELFNGHMNGCLLWLYVAICACATALIARYYRYIEIRLK